MKIVIDIPDKKYKVIQDGNYCGAQRDKARRELRSRRSRSDERRIL